MAIYQETLATYRTRFLREVRDASQQYFTNQVDIDFWINAGIRFRDLWSGGSRAYKAQVPLSVGLDLYDLKLLFPNDSVLDIINLWLIWGNTRIPLSEESLTAVTAFARPLVVYSNIPATYCRYGATQLFIATAPSSAMTADFDVATLSGTLVSPGDPDPLPFPYTEPVPKYAAYLAKEHQRQWDEADRFYNEAIRAIREIEGSRAGELPLAHYGAR